MNEFDVRDRIREILEGKIAMGAGDDDNLYYDGGYRARRRAPVGGKSKKKKGGRLRKFNSGSVSDAAAGINYFDFVKEWQKANPGYSWAESIEMASKPYQQLKAAGVLVGGESDGYLFDGRGGYGTKKGAKKAVKTKLRLGEIKSKPKRKPKRKY